MYARLKPGITRQQAQAAMDTIGANISKEYPTTNKGWGVKIDLLREQIVGAQLRQTLFVLLGTVCFVLLIACANIANLTLARGAARQKEVAIRSALGAGRWRLLG
ncbi:MAG: FtsX-like permease family protein [Verrucomicrobiota bacterium]